MRRSTTSAGTERPLLGLLLIAQLIAAVALVLTSAGTAVPSEASVPTRSQTARSSNTVTLPDGRTATLMSLGGPRTAPLLARISGELDGAAHAVTAFWGPQWRRDIVVVATASDEQFTALAGGGGDIAAATTPEHIVFAPGAATMSTTALRIVLRHELFHYAARSDTAADAPRWLTEGAADFVGRAGQPRPDDQAGNLAVLPTDTDLDTAGPARTLAYDRAWWFTRFVADRYGAQTLRRLYERACGPRHPDVRTAVAETLGADLDEVSRQWRSWSAITP